MASKSGLATTTCPKGATPVLSGLPDHLNNQEFSDFTVKTTAGSISVHRLILSLHSSVLAKACKGEFRETSQACIDLQHEPAACVEAMIYYMYHFDYNLPDTEAYNPSAFHVNMAVIADKYDIMTLGEVAFVKFQADLPSSDDKADVFAETVDVAYENVVAVPDICKYLVEFALDNSEVGVGTVIHPSLKNVMRRHPDLAMTVTEAMHGRMQKVKAEAETKARTSYCPNCRKPHIVYGMPIQNVLHRCHHCNSNSCGYEWQPNNL